MLFIKLYFIALVIFLGLDLVWLGAVAKNLYSERIGFLMADEVKWGSALLFYCIYIAGLVFFALSPALREGNWISALLYGGFFGLVCYAAYDLTNLATLKGWPATLAIYDMLWGTFVSAITCIATFWIANHWKSYFS